MKHIQLTITVDQANLVLEGLGELPFVKVYELIAQLQKQARAQIDQGNQETEQTGPALASGPDTSAIAKLVTGDRHGD